MESSRGSIRLVFVFALFALVSAVPLRVSAAPAAGGTLTVAMSTFSEGTFLPWNGSTGRKFYLDTIYEYLTYLDLKTQEPKPGLAEKWEMSKDGKTFTFWLRKGVQFHEGWGEFTSEDVKYSLERIIDPKAIAGPSSPLRKAIAKVEAPEKYKAVITLNAPDIEFVGGYLSNGLIVPMVCKKYVSEKGDEVANAHPIGTGPYTLAEYKKGVSIKLRIVGGVEKHWRVRPEFQTITFLAVPEESTRVAMLKTGEADLAPINYDSIPAVKAAGLKLISVHQNWGPVIRMGGLAAKFPNPAVPWAKKEVRQALNYAVDKNAIVKGIFHGEAASAGVDFPAPEFVGIAPYPYDPQKAKKLLADAGYPNGFDLTLRTFTTTPGAELPVIAEAVAMQWQAVGVRVKIVPTDWTSLRGAWTTGKATDVAWTHRGLAFSSALAGLQAAFITPSVFASYSNAETDKQVGEIEKELDPKKRAVLCKKMGEYLRDEAANVYLVLANEPFGASKNVGSWPALSQQVTNIDLISRSAK